MRDVVGQTLDDAAAGLGDLASLADLPGVHTLFCSIGRNCERPYSYLDIVRQLTRVHSDLEQAVSELGRLGAARFMAMGDAAKKLIKMLDAIESGDVSAETVASAYRSLCFSIKERLGLKTEKFPMTISPDGAHHDCILVRSFMLIYRINHFKSPE